MAKRKRGSDCQPVLQGFGEPEEAADSQELAGEQKQLPATVGESLDDQTVYVIDAFALIYQVFYAMPNFSGPNGQPVGAVHGFIRDMADLLEFLKSHK